MNSVNNRYHIWLNFVYKLPCSMFLSLIKDMSRRKSDRGDISIMKHKLIMALIASGIFALPAHAKVTAEQK